MVFFVLIFVVQISSFVLDLLPFAQVNAAIALDRSAKVTVPNGTPPAQSPPPPSTNENATNTQPANQSKPPPVSVVVTSEANSKPADQSQNDVHSGHVTSKDRKMLLELPSLNQQEASKSRVKSPAKTPELKNKRLEKLEEKSEKSPKKEISDHFIIGKLHEAMNNNINGILNGGFVSDEETEKLTAFRKKTSDPGSGILNPEKHKLSLEMTSLDQKSLTMPKRKSGEVNVQFAPNISQPDTEATERSMTESRNTSFVFSSANGAVTSR